MQAQAAESSSYTGGFWRQRVIFRVQPTAPALAELAGQLFVRFAQPFNEFLREAELKEPVGRDQRPAARMFELPTSEAAPQTSEGYSAI